MSNLPAIILIILSLCGCLWIIIIGSVAFYFWHNDQKFLAFLRSELPRVNESIRDFSNHLDLQTGYFANYSLNLWKENYAELFGKLKDISLNGHGLEPQESETLRSFLEFYRNAEIHRSDFNKRFIAKELEQYGAFFETLIPGKQLDHQQRTAIVTDEDNNLVIAGAGTGKTTTILGKVHYLAQRYAVAPSDMLLISFTRKSATDLASRINLDALTVNTFHKFGLDVITAVEGHPPQVLKDGEFETLLCKSFDELVTDAGYLGQVIEFFTTFLKHPKTALEFQDQGAYYQYLKDQNFRPYQLVETGAQSRKTLQTEIVRSAEECQIANFLLFNNLDYASELPYPDDVADAKHRQERPDFTITQNEHTVYLEHLGVARNGDVPPFFRDQGETYQAAKQRYWSKIEWARETHHAHKTTLIETFSYEMSEGTLFQNLAQRLQDAGLTLQLKSPEEIWQIILESSQGEVDGFLKLVETFIALLKSNNYTFADVRARNAQISDPFEKARNTFLLAILEPIYERYQRYLEDQHQIDFNDMINRAANYIAKGKCTEHYRYILIDEFQDISIGRYQLVRALKAQNPGCKLFCVGDDWQSIYRFTGSDIALFREFESYFGCTVKSKIETTYRFHEPLIKLSSDFILKNPNQEPKTLKGAGTLPQTTDYKIVYSETDDQDNTLALKQVLDEVVATVPGFEEKNFLLLGRYNSDFGRIKNTQGCFRINPEQNLIYYAIQSAIGVSKTIQAPFVTIHSSKGLEADIVILLNCNAGKYGFPSQVSDDSVLNLLLSKADQFENGEERRLFYVAMTRAREKVYFIADTVYKSKFITELEVANVPSASSKCPLCKTADLVKHSGVTNGKPWAFLGCANYVYGCEYQEWLT